MNATNSILTSFSRTCEEVISLAEFKKKLSLKKPLRIKYGVDVTSPFLHLGHAVNLWMMRELQEQGHKVLFLIGDFTTKIGDPTGRSQIRPVIRESDIERNASAFIEQVSNILLTESSDVFEVKRNSEWYQNLKFETALRLFAQVTHSKLIGRDMFQSRIREGQDIYLHELIYPLLQGYDSVQLQSDLTIVGTDQLFNEMIGRFFQEKYNQKPQVIITTKITAGLDGKNKQSKSLNNYIAITDNPRDKFGKIMSLPDELLIEWFQVYTKLDGSIIKHYEQGLSLGTENPRDVKLHLASLIVSRYHGQRIAQRERTWFVNTFMKRQFPENTTTIEVQQGKYTLLELLSILQQSTSRSEKRRLIQQGGVRINTQKVKDPFRTFFIDPNIILHIKIGKKRFAKVIVSE